MRTRRRYERPRSIGYSRPSHRIRRNTKTSPVGVLLFLGIIFLIAGFILLSNEIIETFYSIAMIIAGGLCIIVIVVSFIAKRLNKKVQIDETKVEPSISSNNDTQSVQAPNLTQVNMQNLNLNQNNEKVVCKYCNCKYDSKKNRCPYCGAPQSR